MILFSNLCVRKRPRALRPRTLEASSSVVRGTRMLCVLFAFIVASSTGVDGFFPGSLQSSSRLRVSTQFDTMLLAKKKKKKPTDRTIAVNRIAYRNYEVIDTIEAGIQLLGTEVKSIRDGKMNLRDGYVRPNKNGRGCVLFNVHIGKHDMAGAYFQHEERRPRPLLVHKEEARKLRQKTEQTGMTIVPLKAYFTDKNLVKVQIALCRGKNVRDKREDIKQRDAQREERRIIKSFRVPAT